MRITFICPHANLSGGIRVVAIYAERLRRLGHEVLIVSKPKRKPKFKDNIRSFLTGQALLPSKPEASHFDNITVPHKVLESFRPVADADIPDADVVVATWWETAEDVANLSKAKGAKAYFIQQHEVFSGMPVERVKATYTLPLHKITISKWLVDIMNAEYGDDDVSLVLNSVDTEQFYAPRRARQSVPTVGTLYHTMIHKGWDISYKAITKAIEEIPDLKVVVFGSYTPVPEFPLPPGAEFIHRPAQDRIKDIYARCDVWLCGSRSEGFHLPPLEAMACHCPVVSTAVGGPMDVIENGKNGYVVPVEDYEALADHLVQVLKSSQDEWQDLSDAAYATATQYTWDEATKLFEKSLHTAIQKQTSALKAAA